MSKSVAIAVACSLATLVATTGTAFAQAGSTGGTLGKTDKSASGGQEDSRQAQRPKVRAGVAGIAGHWRVEVECGGPHTWSFDVRQSSTTEFAGDFNPGGGRLFDGKVEGSRLTFATEDLTKRNWTGTLKRPQAGECK